VKNTISILILLAVFTGQAAVHADISVDSLKTVYGMTLKRGGNYSRYMLKKNGRVCVFGPGIHQMVVDNKSFPLDRPPYFRDGRLFVSSRFAAMLKKKVIDAEGEYWQTVTIDAGHGGKDPGAISPANGIYEKDVVLDIAQRMKQHLQQKGVRVIMTRDRDEFVSLEDRPRKANRAASHLFVSIHADACVGAPFARGVTVFYGDNWPDSNINVRTRANFLAGQMDLNRYVAGRKRRRFAREEEAFVFGLMIGESNKLGRKFAKMIADNLSRDTHTDNRGIKTKNLRVIRRCACPAVLVEVGFLTNRREAERLARKSERRKIAKSLSKTVCAFLKKYVKK